MDVNLKWNNYSINGDECDVLPTKLDGQRDMILQAMDYSAFSIDNRARGTYLVNKQKNHRD